MCGPPLTVVVVVVVVVVVTKLPWFSFLELLLTPLPLKLLRLLEAGGDGGSSLDRAGVGVLSLLERWRRGIVSGGTSRSL